MDLSSDVSGELRAPPQVGRGRGDASIPQGTTKSKSATATCSEFGGPGSGSISWLTCPIHPSAYPGRLIRLSVFNHLCHLKRNVSWGRGRMKEELYFFFELNHYCGPVSRSTAARPRR